MTTNENIPDDNMFDRTKKKKHKKRINPDAPLETTAIPTSTDNMVEDGTTVDGDFTYEYLITRIFDMIRKTNPKKDLNQHTLVLPRLKIGRIGTKRTSFTNFGEICKLLKRQEKSLYDFFVVELGTTASISSDHALIIRGRLGEQQIEHILRSFIKEYVICKTCHLPDTLLKKEERLTVIKCNDCHSQYTVSNIKTGFQAQIGKRSKHT